MKNFRTVIIIAVSLSWAYDAAEMKFDAHILAKGIGSWGKTGFGDFDNDGNLDLTAGPSGSAVYWYRNPGDISQAWERFTIDPKNGGCVGGEPADVDGDGLVDFVSHGMWYRNSKETPGKSFEKFSFNNGGMPGKSGGCHDVIVADINSDGKMDAMNHSVTWWKNPGGTDATKTWESYQVANRPKYHGAIAPHGFGDIDGDGDNDVVGIGEWFKNMDGAGTKWERIEYATWSRKNENRIWVADYDGDGDQDIAVAEGDHGDGTAAWFKNIDGKGQEFQTILLPGIKGDLHSCGGLDFDNDGDRDIFTAQNGGGEDNEWVIFENTDGKGTFEKRVIYTGFGAHESVYADWDGDGDIDIASKCWCRGGALVLLENKLDPKPPGPPGKVSIKVNAENQVEVSWEPPTNFSGKLSYIIYRNDAPLDTISTVQYLDSTINSVEPTNYSVSAIFGKKEGEKSAPQLVTATYTMDKLKKQLSFSARIAGSGQSARLVVSSQTPGPNTLEIFDLQGNRFMALKNEGPASNSISFRDLDEGVTIIRLNTPKGAITEKIVF